MPNKKYATSEIRVPVNHHMVREIKQGRFPDNLHPQILKNLGKTQIDGNSMTAFVKFPFGLQDEIIYLQNDCATPMGFFLALLATHYRGHWIRQAESILSPVMDLNRESQKPIIRVKVTITDPTQHAEILVHNGARIRVTTLGNLKGEIDAYLNS